MRKFIVKILATASSFYVAQYYLAGVQLDNYIATYLLVSFVFVLFNFVLSPIIKLLLLPINLLTLGLFRWVTNVLVLYLFDLVYDGISISAFAYPALQTSWLTLPPGYLGLFWVLVLTSLIMSLTYSFISILFAPES
ncbi:MAG: phage holin family protein [bacterium]